jgi:2-methylcitrate dehydratase PrpD
MIQQEKTMLPTERMATFISGARYMDLPSGAIDRSIAAITDYFACVAAGSREPTGAKIISFVRELAAPGSSTVVSMSPSTSAPNAALANGTLGHVLDYDDVNWRMIGHPGVSILPAVFALAEDKHASGADVILAYAVGFEVATRLGNALNDGHYGRGWHATGTLGTIAAAAGAAKLLGLSEDRAASALGIAASFAGGLRQNFGTDTKPLHAGRAAQNGTVAAMLASRGFTADTHILEAEWGFFSVFAGDGQPARIDAIENGLGDTWALVDPGFLTKNYPSCGSTHPAIDAILDLVTEHRIEIGEIEKVDVGVVRLTPKILIHNDPKTGLEAKFSMPYCVAVALLDGAVKINSFSEQAVADDHVRSLMRKIRMYVAPEIDDDWTADDPRPVVVAICMKDGREYKKRVDYPRGMPQNPLTQQDLELKYRDCTASVLSESNMGQSLEMLKDLGRLSDVHQLMSLFEATP